ncbi:P-loop containing nucleoside triphosphate hydrolase protein [Fimicolochytrium jonesii]|uniref:P-loop containing nucleoside triphosphate hydrolase protein n=1 Tax=Fimicolochytrium jonesii TaxID=1396493 RepID=UPI0022FDF73C|nr:P-loop containing nucleoside triphosphate hydrolase protein [Fimicolochytrium jonesii]KAI8821328.1 P-loop containing nucleoside triphosphate hydrolase protein [Fimicolochytrium jonesii]
MIGANKRSGAWDDDQNSPQPVLKKSRADPEAQARKEARSLEKKHAKDSTVESRVRRHIWLWELKGLFEPLLPEKNYFTKTEAPSGGKAVPYEQLGQPTEVKATMKPYQLTGLSFLVNLYRNGMNGILGDEMGLGKTLQTLSLFSHVKASGDTGPFLVVCPLSVLNSWLSETHRWTPHLTAITFHGSAHERIRLKSEYLHKQFDICITTYEMFVSESHWFKYMSWKYCVLDEGHKIKNETSQVSQTLQGIKSEFRLLLTGTPVQNNLHELWVLFRWLLPEVFTDQTADLFSRSFDLGKGTYDIEFLGNARSLLERIMLRRMKAQVDFQIPAREEITLYVPITKMQRFWYKRLLTRLDTMTLKEIFDHTAKAEGGSGEADDDLTNNLKYSLAGGSGKGDWKKMMNLLMQLRKCCNHPYMLPDSEPEPFVTGEHLVLASAKMILLDKLLAHLRECAHKSLIFSGFTGMLDILEDYMIFRNIRYARLDGTTPRARRNLLIKLFQHKDSPYDVFLVSTKAGGLGINLTAADTVIFMDNDWNPQTDLQALARAHRIGQTKKVTVYRLVCQDTVEEQMLTRLQKKLFLSLKVTEDMRDPNGEGVEANLSTGQLMSMLRRGARALTRVFETAEDFAKSDIKHIIEKSKEYQNLVDAEADKEEDFELEGMEQVQSRLFEGAVVPKDEKSIAEEWKDLKKRERQERVVMVGTHAVLKETVGCDQWEARSTFSKGMVITKKKKIKKYIHQEMCHVCGKDSKEEFLECSGCPRSYHPECTETQKTQFGWYCPQHFCAGCGKNTGDAGDLGLIYLQDVLNRSEDEGCTNWDEITPIGFILPELLLCGLGEITQAYYIRCADCTRSCVEDPAFQQEIEAQMEADWKRVEEGEDESIVQVEETKGKNGVGKAKKGVKKPKAAKTAVKKGARNGKA